METIYERRVISELNKYIRTDDVIVIHGARQVGKTSILMFLQDQLGKQSEKTLYIDLEDSRFVSLLDQGVDEFLNYLRGEGHNLDTSAQTGQKLFVMIDEIQYLSNPSSFLKLIADHHRYLKLIVSGSSSFEMKSKFKDSLVGRTINFEIYPLSFREMLLFQGVSYVPEVPLTSIKLKELQSLYLEYALYGGYPKIVLTPEIERKERYLQQIIDTYVRKDIRDMAEITDVNRFNNLLEVLAAQSGNPLNTSELSNTCDLSKPTVERYLFLLEQTYILKLVRPYSQNLRKEITKRPKIFFLDTGLMQMLWLKHLQKTILGPVFETSLFAELIKKYGPEPVTYWRTTDKQEIDFVIKRAEGVLPVESKIQFPRAHPQAFKRFWQNVQQANPPFLLVGLNGTPADSHMIYPWQLDLDS